MKRLRVLLFETPHDPYYNLAMEEALYYLGSRYPRQDPVLRIWRNANAVIIGYFQRAEEEVRLDFAERKGIAIVRRFTGGGAVYHDLGNINYAVIAERLSGDPIKDLYGFLIKGVINALKGFGADPRIENVNDIVVGDAKVSGTAASFRDRTLFLHGSLLVSTDLETLSSVLNISRKKLEDKRVSSVKYRVKLLEEILGRRVGFSELVDKIVGGYAELFGSKPYCDLPTKEEVEAAKILKEEKYGKEEWNLRRFPSSSFKKAYELIDDLLAQTRG